MRMDDPIAGDTLVSPKVDQILLAAEVEFAQRGFSADLSLGARGIRCW